MGKRLWRPAVLERYLRRQAALGKDSKIGKSIYRETGGPVYEPACHIKIFQGGFIMKKKTLATKISAALMSAILVMGTAARRVTVRLPMTAVRLPVSLRQKRRERLRQKAERKRPAKLPEKGKTNQGG